MNIAGEKDYLITQKERAMIKRNTANPPFSIQAHSLAPDLSSTPNPVFAELRNDNALYYSPSYNAWLVSRYVDNQFVLANAQLFRTAKQPLKSSPEQERIQAANLTHQGTALFKLAKSFTYNISSATPFDVIQVFAKAYVLRSFTTLFRLNGIESECLSTRVLESQAAFLGEKQKYFQPSSSSSTILNEFYPSTSIISIQLLTRALYLLTAEPELWRQLHQSPATITAFLEEAWRLYSPYSGTLLHAQKDLVLYGTSIPAQSRIVALSSSANRDPDQFPCPDTFCLHRPNIGNYHALGNGRDKCLPYQICLQLSVAAIKAFLTSFKSISMASEVSPEITRSFLSLRFDRLMLNVRR